MVDSVYVLPAFDSTLMHLMLPNVPWKTAVHLPAVISQLKLLEVRGHYALHHLAICIAVTTYRFAILLEMSQYFRTFVMFDMFGFPTSNSSHIGTMMLAPRVEYAMSIDHSINKLLVQFCTDQPVVDVLLLRTQIGPELASVG